jgi:glutathione S-transferase
MTLSRTLHHFPLDPPSRFARLVLGEKKIDFAEVVVRPWEPNPAFEALNPAGTTPVLAVGDLADRLVLCETAAIIGWAEDTTPDPALMPRRAPDRAEVRRLVQWFERKFDYEVNALLLHEKMEKRLLGLGAPDSTAVREGRDALHDHMAHLEKLVADRDWLACSRLTFADFAAAAHFSVLDYFGEVPWSDYAALKLWYSKMKSRPCFRPVLSDRQAGMPPSRHYDDLDF